MTVANLSNSALCCHWCKTPLGGAKQVTYLNGNLPVCDLCLKQVTPKREGEYIKCPFCGYWYGATSDELKVQQVAAGRKAIERVKELEKEVERLKVLAFCEWSRETDHQLF